MPDFLLAIMELLMLNSCGTDSLRCRIVHLLAVNGMKNIRGL